MGELPEKSKEEVKEEEITEETEEENMMDYASKRLVELKNSEQRFMTALSQAEAQLEQARANLIACRARIGEMTLMIEKKSPPPKKP